MAPNPKYVSIRAFGNQGINIALLR